MNFKSILFVLSVCCVACQNVHNKADTEKHISSDTVLTRDTIKNSDLLKGPDTAGALLAITSNALQVVRLPSGSTSEIPVGMEMNQVLETVARVLEVEIPRLQVNSECGAGPMTMAMFENGLTLMFQKSDSKPKQTEFVGWSLSDRIRVNKQNRLTTMSGIGIGSTRAELESVYKVTIEKSTLGVEFSTGADGLYGILDGSSANSKIDFMWSGLSCNFR